MTLQGVLIVDAFFSYVCTKLFFFRTGDLSTGDRIVEVDGVPLLTSDQDIAVAAIAKAGNPIRFIVQSLQKHKVSICTYRY